MAITKIGEQPLLPPEEKKPVKTVHEHQTLVDKYAYENGNKPFKARHTFANRFRINFYDLIARKIVASKMVDVVDGKVEELDGGKPIT